MSLEKIQVPNDFCENLEVQNVQFIQPNGIFIAIEIENFNIKYVSSNYALFFEKNLNDIIGNKFDIFLTKDSIIKLKKFITHSNNFTYKGRSVLEIELLKCNNTLEKKTCLIYLSKNLLCIESQIEFIDNNVDEKILLIDNMIQEVTHSNKTKEDLAALICKFIREITEFDRVYYCEFQEDGHGFVPAEDKNENTESILYHRFPATDLPYIVRKLYTKSRFRMISDAYYEPIPIIGCTEKLDLSRSLFRDIGSSHIKYLKNMGTCASASFSVVEGENLKGLIGCHSATSKSISLALFPKLKTLIESFTTKILNFELSNLKYNKPNIDFNLIEFLKSYENSNCDLLKLNKSDFIPLKKIFDAQTILYCVDDISISDTDIPNEFIQLFKETVINNFKENEITASEKLVKFNRKFNEYTSYAAGFILIPISISSNNYIVFFRKEQTQVYKWKGDPNAFNLEQQGILNPRNSFSTWYEEIKDICIPWNNENISMANEIRVNMLNIRSNYLKKLSQTNADLEQKNKEIEILLSEVNHRVKNNLAIVSSLFDWKI